MQFSLFGDFASLCIRMYDENNDHVGTISINTTTDQVIEVLKSKCSLTLTKQNQKKLADKMKQVVMYSLMIIQG